MICVDSSLSIYQRQLFQSYILQRLSLVPIFGPRIWCISLVDGLPHTNTIRLSNIPCGNRQISKKKDVSHTAKSLK